MIDVALAFGKTPTRFYGKGSTGFTVIRLQEANAIYGCALSKYQHTSSYPFPAVSEIHCHLLNFLLPCILSETVLPPIALPQHLLKFDRTWLEQVQLCMSNRPTVSVFTKHPGSTCSMYPTELGIQNASRRFQTGSKPRVADIASQFKYSWQYFCCSSLSFSAL